MSDETKNHRLDRERASSDATLTDPVLMDASGHHWILLRGLAREARHWGRFNEQLAQAMGPGAKVDAIDLPGAGRFSEMRSPTSMHQIAEFIRLKFHEIRNRQRERGEMPAAKSHLVAISLGAMVATEWVNRWREDFSSLVLINTSFNGFSPLYQRLRPEAYWHLLKAAGSQDMREREAHILRLICNRPDVREMLLEEWTAIQQNRPVSLENVIRQLAAAARFTPPTRAPGLPTLILGSGGDRMVAPSCSEAIAAKWQVEFDRHPTAGHDLPLDEPDWVLQRLARFYRRLTNAV
jgi:pimeloyl-ACP methyl ester carboxylesterase